MARKKIVLTDTDKNNIERLSGLGLSVQKIAASLGISKATLDRRISKDESLKVILERGRGNAIEQISSVAFKMALSGKHPAMTMFWLKSRAGWGERAMHDDEDEMELVFCK